MRTIRSRLSWLLVLASTLSVVGSMSMAFGQDPVEPGMPPDIFGNGFPGGGMGMMPAPGRPSLLSAKAVQDDLALTEKQKSQLKKLEGSLQQKMRESMMVARDEGADPQEMMGAMTSLRREYDVAVARQLDPAQKARLAEIDLQREGVLAVARPEVASKLKLTPPQTKKIKTIVAEMRQGTMRNMPAPPEGGVPPNFDDAEVRAKMTTMMEAMKKGRAAAADKVAAVLTPEQREAFDKMTGKKFDLTRLDGPPTVDKVVTTGEEATPKTEVPAKTSVETKMRKKKPR